MDKQEIIAFLKPYQNYIIGGAIIAVAGTAISIYASLPEYMQDNIRDRIESQDKQEEPVDPSDPFGYRKQGKEDQEAETQLTGYTYAKELSAVSSSCTGCSEKVRSINTQIVEPNNTLYKKYTERREYYLKQQDKFQEEHEQIVKLFEALEEDEDGNISGDVAGAQKALSDWEQERAKMIQEKNVELVPMASQLRKYRETHKEETKSLQECEHSLKCETPFILITPDDVKEHEEIMEVERKEQGYESPAIMIQIVTECEDCKEKAQEVNDTIVAPHNALLTQFNEVNEKAKKLETDIKDLVNKAAQIYIKNGGKLIREQEDGIREYDGGESDSEIQALEKEQEVKESEIHTLIETLDSLEDRMNEYKENYELAKAQMANCEAGNKCEKVMEVDTEVKMKVCRDGQCFDL